MGWSEKYKKSIDCNNPKGFSQKAHCAGRKKKNEDMVFEEITEDILNEKLITYGNRKPYGQIVFMAGGAGSGKGFAIKNFVDSASFKIRDVDEMKKQLQILNRLGKVDIRGILKKYGRNIKLKDLDLIRKIEKDGYRLQNLNLKNPDHVYALHTLVKAMGIKDSSLTALLTGKNNPETLPNILFDITAKDVTDITSIIPKLKEVGYKADNIHLTWILTSYVTAMYNNKNRSRMVPEDILLKTHEGAANTVWGLVTKALPKGMNGRVDVILNNPEHTVFYTDADGKTISGGVKGFLSLPLKKEKGGIFPEKVWKEKLFGWVKQNAPDSITANMEESVNERADYKYLTQVILDAKPKYNVYYNSSHNVVNIGGVGYDKGELVKNFNQKPGSSSNIKTNFFHANKDPQKTKREVEKLSNGKIKVTIGKGYGNEPIVYYSLKESIDESTLSQIHKAAKKGSYPVTIVATMLGKVVKQELVKTPMAVPAAVRMMQGGYPKAKISVEDSTGKILFQEAKLNHYRISGNSIEFYVKDKGKNLVLRFNDKRDFDKLKLDLDNPKDLQKILDKRPKKMSISMGENTMINEISAINGLKQVVKGNTKEVEGIKVSKEMAQAMIDWFNSSPYGRKYPKAKNARLHVSIGVMLAFGLDRYAKHKGAKEEIKYLKSMKEAYKGNMSDFKYEFPNTFEDETGNSTKAIKKVSKKGKGYEVRTSTYMSEPEMKKVGDALGLKLVNYQKSGNIAVTLYESVSENFTPEQSYNGLFKFKYKGKKYVGKVLRNDGGKYTLGLNDNGLFSIPNISKNDMEYLGNVSDQGKKGLPYLSGHPKNFKKVEKDEFHAKLVFKGGLTMGLSSYLSNSTLNDINKYYKLKLTKDDLKGKSVNEGKFKPSQVRSAISKVKKGLMRKWKQKGGYENFGQKELSQMKDKFDYNPYGSSDEREVAKMLDGFDNWAMNYDGNMREAYVVLYAPKKGVPVETTAAYKDKKDAEKWAKSLGGITMIVKKKVKGIDEKIEERVNLFFEENCPTDAGKWSYYKGQAKKKFDVYPSAYANGWAAKQYKAAGGGWKKCK